MWDCGDKSCPGVALCVDIPELSLFVPVQQ